MPKPTLVDARPEIVTLADLAPRHDVVGGAGKRVFGAATVDSPSQAESSSTAAVRRQRKHQKRTSEQGQRSEDD